MDLVPDLMKINEPLHRMAALLDSTPKIEAILDSDSQKLKPDRFSHTNSRTDFYVLFSHFLKPDSSKKAGLSLACCGVYDVLHAHTNSQVPRRDRVQGRQLHLPH
jgi:hypothetical protein